MPFVPLGNRKRLEVILDEDKARLGRAQQLRDQETINRHYGVAAGSSGYRFAHSPATLGSVRGPQVPFQGATSSWRPPSADRNGPASQHSRNHADYGAYWEAAHSMKSSRSEPSLSPEVKKSSAEACHPLAIELLRWKNLAQVTVQRDLKGHEPPSRAKPEPPKEKKVTQKAGGLVLFPKYMLFNDSHLKMQDLQRFQRDQMAAAEEESEGPRTATPSSTYNEATAQSFKLAANWQSASSGAPLLRKLGMENVLAGSALPGGRTMKTSNPFR